MKKASGPTTTAAAGSHRDTAASSYTGHRQPASSSVGTSLKSRASAAAAGESASAAASANNSERTGYHATGAAASKTSAAFKQQQIASGTAGGAQSLNAATGQERKCDSCKYRTPINQCTTFRCRDCGTYIICEYCYEDYMEKGGYYDSNSDSTFTKKIQCVYCWSRHTLTDICVKTLKSLGFMPVKGSNKIQISNLTREKIKKLSNLRVIQKTLVYVIGIAPEIASESKLKSVEYFGQYGNLQKVVVNTKDVYNATRGGPSYSAYLTFHSARESAIAILSVDQFVLNDRMIRASFGTSKFCQFFLNNQKCNNKDCLYLHELRADLEAYTKEDMQNNKFIFLEQQKIAIKLSKALDLSKEQFNKYNLDRNEAMRVATERAKNTGVPIKAALPEPSFIYHKDFHFLDEPLIDRQQKREAALKEKATVAKQASKSNNEIDSASTAATDATVHSSQSTTAANANLAPSSGQSAVQGAKPVAKISAKQLKPVVSETPEENKSSVMPIFTNQKDVSNQARKQSQLRAPLSKAMIIGLHRAGDAANVTDSSSAKNSHSTANSATNTATNSESRLNEQSQQASTSLQQNKTTDSSSSARQASQTGHNKSTTSAEPVAQTSTTLFPFEQQTPEIEEDKPSQGGASEKDESLNILTKQNNQTGATVFQNLLQTQLLANQAAQNEKISIASAAAAERFRKKDLNQKKKKKIVVEQREQVPLNVVEANIKKVDTTTLATQSSPLKLGTKEQAIAGATTLTTVPLKPEQALKEPSAVTMTVSRPAQHETAATKKRNPSSGGHAKAPLSTAAANHEKQTMSNSQQTQQHSAPQQTQAQGKQSGASTSQPPSKMSTFKASASVNLANNRVPANGGSELGVNTTKEKPSYPDSGSVGPMTTHPSGKAKKPDFMQTQAVSLGGFKKLVSETNDCSSEVSPGLANYGREQSRFQFAHSLDPIKKEGGFKFGFGCALAASSEVDKDEILVPMKVQELIHRSIRTLSNSISNRSPDEHSTKVADAVRDASSSLVPVQEIEPELEVAWYTLEEQAQEQMMQQQQRDGKQSPPLYEESKGGDATMSGSNPFRMLNKKDKDHQVVNSANLDVKRVKYSYKQTSPSGEHGGDQHDEDHHQPLYQQQQQNKSGKTMTASPFQPSNGGKDGARVNKGARRPGPQGERARQPPTNR